MPPQTAARRPDEAANGAFISFLETGIDKAATAKPNPGHASLHRLNRTEYGNAIRDLLGLQIDAASLLPADDESYGFDNIADVLKISPSLMQRYISASWTVSRLAVGNTGLIADFLPFSPWQGQLLEAARARRDFTMIGKFTYQRSGGSLYLFERIPVSGAK